MEQETLESLTQKYMHKAAAVADAQVKIKAMEAFVVKGFEELAAYDKQAGALQEKQKAAEAATKAQAQ